MTAKMQVLTLKATGHILAAVARTDTGGKPDVASLAGTDLPVTLPRSQGDMSAAIAMPVPADLMEAKEVLLDAAVIAHPLAHVVDGGRIAALPPVVASTASTLDPSKTTVQTAVADVPVVVVILGKDDPAIRRAGAGRVLAAATSVDITHTILPGEPPAGIPAGMDYFLLIAEGGRRLRLEIAST
jgi:hypothetical protein